MATGALDSNGIWQYGEDDSETTFSGLLNKLAGSTSDTVTRLEGFTGFTGTVPTANLPTIPVNKGGTGATTVAGAQDALAVGMTKISPASVQVSSGSATATGNRVVFYDVGTLHLNGIFSSGFMHYRLMINLDYMSANNAYKLSMRSSGTTNYSNYDYNGSQVVGSSAIDRYYGLPDTGYVPSKNLSGNVGVITVDIFNPFSASQYTMFVSNSRGTTGGAIATFSSTGAHGVAASYDGISIYPTAGIHNGMIEIYGYNHG